MWVFEEEVDGQKLTEIIQFSTAASRATRSALSAEACLTHTRNAAATSLKSAYPLSPGSSSIPPLPPAS